jgi:phage terminase small subunit
MSDSIEKTELTHKQKLFCEYYVSKEFFGNGTQSYIKAYQVDLTKAGAYDVARSGASENLAKPYIYEYINDLLEQNGLNDAFVDKQLLFLISQHAEFGAKISAIKEYNKLKQRITDKVDHTTGGKEIRNWTIEPVKPTDESK